MEVVRDVLFTGALKAPEVGQITVSGMVEANDASMKLVGKAHKVVLTFVRPMVEERDVNGV